MTSSTDSLDGKVLKWSGAAMVVFLLASFLAGVHAPSFAQASTKADVNPAAFHVHARHAGHHHHHPWPGV